MLWTVCFDGSWPFKSGWKIQNFKWSLSIKTQGQRFKIIVIFKYRIIFEGSGGSLVLLLRYVNTFHYLPKL